MHITQVTNKTFNEYKNMQIAVFTLALMMMIMMKALCECEPVAAAVEITKPKNNIFKLVQLN